jgi:hypothetical protein
MQELDIRYVFILLPLLYATVPFLLTGNFLLLGAISVTIFIVGAVLFALIFSLNIGGSGTIIASGVSGKFGLNQEGTYMLFVLVFGGLFYGVTTFVLSFLDTIIGIWNFFLGWLGLGISIGGASVSDTTYIINSPSQIYPSSFVVGGLPIFPLITVLMGLVYIVGMFFLISSRGK